MHHEHDATVFASTADQRFDLGASFGVQRVGDDRLDRNDAQKRERAYRADAGGYDGTHCGATRAYRSDRVGFLARENGGDMTTFEPHTTRYITMAAE